MYDMIFLKDKNLKDSYYILLKHLLYLYIVYIFLKYCFLVFPIIFNDAIGMRPTSHSHLLDITLNTLLFTIK
jgi:hypothetical protein